MRILAAADIHGAQYRMNIILKNIEKYKPDIVIICGDITNFGPEELATTLLNQIPTETLVVIGNCDPFKTNNAINESRAENLHLKTIEIKGLNFLGIGGDIPANLEEVKTEKNKNLKDVIDSNTVLVTHVPPYKLQDKVYIGHHVGSKQLRDLINKTKPKLVLCGHVHEDPGCTKIDDTIVVNCSIGKKTEGALIKINEKIDVEILD